jgi:putative SOS response-associated peptidase YedK
MCGFLGNITDSPLTQALMILLEMEDVLPALHHTPGTGPAGVVDVILQDVHGRRIQPAVWWLLLERDPRGGHKPSKYTSFNTRSDKLDVKRSVGYGPYRNSRCIVPATYFIEGDGPKGARRYHRVEPLDAAFALGGLYRTWLDQKTGEVTYSCSVITLPPHPSEIWRQVHSQSTPLMLPVKDADLIARWLDPGFDRVEAFDVLLEPSFPQAVTCVSVERPGHQREIGKSFVIEADNSTIQ